MNIPRKVLKAVSFAIANRDIRSYLNGMYVECSGRTVRLVATDGHRLHLMDVPQNEPCAPLPAGIIVPRTLIDWALKQTKPNQSVQITTEGGAITITAGGAGMSGTAIDGPYLDYIRALPAVVSGKTAQFNPQYVSDAYAAVKELAGKGEDSFPTLRHNGLDAATVAYERFLAVIMPLRETMGYEPDVRLFAPVADEAPPE